jgi:hypothetical protein
VKVEVEVEVEEALRARGRPGVYGFTAAGSAAIAYGVRSPYGLQELTSVTAPTAEEYGIGG